MNQSHQSASTTCRVCKQPFHANSALPICPECSAHLHAFHAEHQTNLNDHRHVEALLALVLIDHELHRTRRNLNAIDTLSSHTVQGLLHLALGELNRHVEQLNLSMLAIPLSLQKAIRDAVSQYQTLLSLFIIE
jgi:predicted amidophosphoribosyltransferase